MKVKKIGPINNPWKWLFLLLLAVNLAFISVVASRILQGRVSENQIASSKSADDIKIGTFSTGQEEINQTVAAFLKDYQTDDMTFQLEVNSKEVEFQGTYQLLGFDIPLYLYFEPYRLETGAIQLQVTSLSVGSLALPEAEVLSYLKSQYDLPDFVQILPEKSAININLQDVDNEMGVYLKTTTINLSQDKFNFEIFKKID